MLPPPLPLLHPPNSLRIRLEPLTPAAFAPFGTAIESPLPASTHAPNTTSAPTPPLHPQHQPQPILANQSTAYKYAPISPLAHNYPGRARPQMSMFSCFPRQLERDGSGGSDGSGARFAVQILERHPFTTQTFVPLGGGDAGGESMGAVGAGMRFLVVVAPSLAGTTSSSTGEPVRHAPDLARLRAFAAHGAQAVTYAAGTWHAPMVVVGERRVDFVVTQFVSGVQDEDCQEVSVGDGVVVALADNQHLSVGNATASGPARARL